MTRGAPARLVAASTPACAALACAALACAALAGCATGAVSGTDSTAAPTGAGSTATSPPATPTTTTHTTTTATTAAPSRTARPSGTPTTLPADYCTAGQLTLRVLPGGAIQGYEIAAVSFTNASSTECSLSGYPAVQLLLGGRVLSTATPATAHAPGLVHLAPGAQAQAQIRDHSTCQAPLSETIHVAAPAPLDSLRLDRPFQLRGCAVVVDPVSPSS